MASPACFADLAGAVDQEMRVGAGESTVMQRPDHGYVALPCLQYDRGCDMQQEVLQMNDVWRKPIQQRGELSAGLRGIDRPRQHGYAICQALVLVQLTKLDGGDEEIR